ncbi:MAG: histidinol-phosphatase [Calditrichaeota bacterium]|nr:histidinol-phosphatase [Calditrichota bacterium]RQW05640.1 MAG: histidinol-phosphatase [Calditrichota bacterium]
MTELSEFRKFIELLVRESGRIIKMYFRQDIRIEIKTDNSPVTIADKKAEERLRKLIEKEFPDHGIWGEEFGKTNESAEYQWVLDPIDGTKSFIYGVPLFGTLIALMRNGQPILGSIHLPVQNELLTGDNKQTDLNGRAVSFRACTSLSDAVLLFTDYEHFSRYQNRKKFDRLLQKVSMSRTWGDCYGYYMVATGRADIMIDAIMSPWDIMALVPVIRGAGGVITDYDGSDPVEGNSIIAAAKNIHSEVVNLLNQ